MSERYALGPATPRPGRPDGPTRPSDDRPHTRTDVSYPGPALVLPPAAGEESDDGRAG